MCHEFAMFRLAGLGGEIGPDFKHAAGFVVEHAIAGSGIERADPTVEPRRGADQQLKRGTFAKPGPDIPQAHQGLVQRVLRGPDHLPAHQQIKVTWRDAEHPFAAVGLLAALEIGENGTDAGAQFLVAVRGEACGGRQPVAQEMPAQLRERSFPAAVLGLRVLELRP